MAAEVVDDDDVARLEGRQQALLDIGKEGLSVDRPVDDAGSVDTVAAKRGQECEGAPSALGYLGQQLLPARRPAAPPRHIGLGPRLVDEDQPAWIEPVLISLPVFTPSGDVGAVLLGGSRPDTVGRSPYSDEVEVEAVPSGIFSEVLASLSVSPSFVIITFVHVR